jgi:hypothetical protein
MFALERKPEPYFGYRYTAQRSRSRKNIYGTATLTLGVYQTCFFTTQPLCGLILYFIPNVAKPLFNNKNNHEIRVRSSIFNEVNIEFAWRLV